MDVVKHRVASALCAIVESAAKPIYVCNINRPADDEEVAHAAMLMQGVSSGGSIVTPQDYEITTVSTVVTPETLEKCILSLTNYLDSEVKK